MSSFHSVVPVAVSAILLSACASSSPPVQAEWRDAGLGAQSSLLRGATVVIACEAPDPALRSICEEQLASEVEARGAKPVRPPPETALLNDRAVDGQLLPGARTSNARAILVLTLTPHAAETGSGLSIGIGGFGFGRNTAGGVGLSAPVGGTQVATGFAANGRVTDVASGRLVWTASAAAPPSNDLTAQFAALSQAVLDSADRAGLF